MSDKKRPLYGDDFVTVLKDMNLRESAKRVDQACKKMEEAFKILLGDILDEPEETPSPAQDRALVVDGDDVHPGMWSFDIQNGDLRLFDASGTLSAVYAQGSWTSVKYSE